MEFLDKSLVVLAILNGATSVMFYIMGDYARASFHIGMAVAMIQAAKL